MKAGWEKGPLSSFFETSTGSTPSKKNKAYYGAGIPLVKPPELKGGYLCEASDNLTKFGASEARVLPEDSILVSCIGNLGKIAMNSVPVAFNQQINAIKPNPTYAIPKFVFYFVQSPLFLDQLNALSKGTTVPIVNKTSFNSIEIALPPLEEQKRIVAILDEAFAGLDRARAHTEANLQNARDLFASFVNESFSNADHGSRIVLFEQVARIDSVLVDPREETYLDLPHVGAGNMVTGTDQLVSIKTSREEKLKSGKFPFDEKMVLYSKIRPYLRKVSRPNFKGVCSADVYPLMPIDGVMDRNYLFHLLLGPDFTEYAIKGSDRVGMPKVNRKHLFAYEFALPDISKQKTCAAKIDKIMDELKFVETEYQSKLIDLDDLRQSLLQKAFAGELT